MRISDWSSDVCSSDLNSNTIGIGTGTSQQLRATTFDLSAVPDGAVIVGIEVRIQKIRGGATSVTDQTVRLVSGGILVGDNKPNATDWETYLTETDVDYGGAGDDWNASLTAADVKNSGFGIAE